MLCLVASYNGESIRFALPQSEARLGSGANNEILLPFPGVSRSHALVIPTTGGLLLRDVGSKNRLYIGDRKVDEATLAPGVTVQVGRALLTIEDASTSDVEVAFVVPRRAAESTGQRTDERSPAEAENDAADALRFARSLELAGARRVRKELQLWVSRLRDVLQARAIVLFETDDNDEAMIASGGVLPDVALIKQIAAAVQMDRKPSPSMLRIIAGTRVLTARTAGRGRTRCVAAILGSGSETLEEWQRDLFEFSARKFLETDSSIEDDAAASESVLQIPDAMVIGESAAMRNLLSQIRATVHSRMDVLLWGETGTGKELIARMVHASGPTAKGPFVAINCAAIPNELLESELFGVHGRVATGVDPRPGLFVQADGGSIFLDEIGELAAPLQAKLLRVLQEREVLPLGAPAPRKIDLRVIASSNRNLLQRAEEGRFRADLYYRLRGLQFHIPPLRERRDDIAPVVLAFMARASEAHHRQIRGISRKALQLLMEHDWPGNVRELQSEVERAVLVCHRGGTLQVEHFGPVKWAVERKSTAAPAPDPPAPTPAAPAMLQDRIDALEREAIENALRAARGNKSLAAKMLGITRNGLAMKMRRLAITIR